MRARVAAAILALGAGASGLLEGQQVGGTGIAYRVEHRVLFSGSVREQTGTFVGGEGWAGFGPVELRARGLMGALSGASDPAHPERDVRTSSLSVAVRVAPWLVLGAEAEAWRFESSAGTTLWRLIGATGRLEAPLGVPGLLATAEGSYYPSAEVVNGEEMQVALRAAAGTSYRPPGAPVVLSLGYRFDRFDLATGSAARLEQFRGVFVAAGLRIGR